MVRYISTERYEMLVSSEVYHCTPNGGYIALRAEGTLHSERRVHYTPSEVYLPTRSGGIYTLARVAPTHSLEWYLPTNPSGTCTPKLYKLLRLNFKLFHNSETFQLFPAPINNPAAERRGIKPSARIKCKVLKWTTFMGRRGSVCVPFRAKAW